MSTRDRQLIRAICSLADGLKRLEQAVLEMGADSDLVNECSSRRRRAEKILIEIAPNALTDVAGTTV